MATIQLVLSEQEKQDAEIIFKKLGMTTSGAIRLFLNQSVLEQGLPFRPRLIKEFKEEKYD